MQFPVKLNYVALGDANVGKSRLLETLTLGYYTPDYRSPLFEHWFQNLSIDDQPYEVALWDTAEGDDFERLRKLSYPCANLFVLCFSCDSLESLNRLETKWLPEYKSLKPEAPFIVVCTRIDLRHDSATLERLHQAKLPPPISTEEGAIFANRIGASYYHEVSSLQKIGTLNLVEESIRQVFLRPRKAKTCIIL